MSRLNTATGSLTSPKSRWRQPIPPSSPSIPTIASSTRSGKWWIQRHAQRRGWRFRHRLDNRKADVAQPTKLRRQGPCHLAVDSSGQCVLAAHYGSGSVAAFPIRADGSLARWARSSNTMVPALTRNGRKGRMPTPSGSTSPIAGLFAPTSDSTRFSSTSSNRKQPRSPQTIHPLPHSPPARVPPFCHGSNGRHLYVINELSNTIAVFNYDVARVL